MLDEEIQKMTKREKIKKLENKIEEAMDSKVTIEEMDDLLDEMEELVADMFDGLYLVE